ncbi:MAG: hypothetical protein JO213_04200, partial [Alphaproteobacteria bacterium]|nr:hypothetical protein [Alphaproteobacteria bacterium]
KQPETKWPSPIALSFIAVVVVPIALVAVYLFVIAADQYVSEFRFSLNSAEQPRPDPLSWLTGNSTHAPAASEAQIIAQYITSRAIVDQLDASLDLRRMFSPPEADWWARLPRPSSIEALVQYWRGQIDPFYDPANGTVTAPRLSVTFHTLLTPPRFDHGAFMKALLALQWPTAARIHAGYRRHRMLSCGIADYLHRLQRSKQVSAIVHNRRDFSDAKYLYGFENVFEHPLAFLTETEVDAVLTCASRSALPMVEALPAEAVLIGVFGFLNEYKGFGTAIEALHHLPPNYHLLIFGGIHPNEITARQQIHPYISSLFNAAYIGKTVYDQLSLSRGQTAPALTLGSEHGLSQLLAGHPRDLSGRIHFMGALGDHEFLTGMAVCDAVLFPYLEVGQSASGPISQALELGCRIIASRTHAFLEFAEYHRGAIELFDIGNYLELAERILAGRQFAAVRKLPKLNAETNKAIYLLANGRPPTGSGASAQARRAEQAAHR